jgi:hypothetical protein
MTMGYLKGKSAVRIHRGAAENERNVVWSDVLGTGLLCEHSEFRRVPDTSIYQNIKEQEKLQKKQLEFDFD